MQQKQKIRVLCSVVNIQNNEWKVAYFIEQFFNSEKFQWIKQRM